MRLSTRQCPAIDANVIITSALKMTSTIRGGGGVHSNKTTVVAHYGCAVGNLDTNLVGREFVMESPQWNHRDAIIAMESS